MASIATVSDIVGRGTRASTQQSNAMERYSSAISLLFTFFGARWLSGRGAYLVGGLLSLLNAGVYHFGAIETLVADKVRPWAWPTLNPFHWTSFYGRSEALLPHAVHTVSAGISAYYAQLNVYRSVHNSAPPSLMPSDALCP